MLVEHGPVLPEGDEWVYEYAWPGERVLASKDDSRVRLVAAAHRRDLTNRFPVVAAAVAKLAGETLVLDGVIGSMDAGAMAKLGREGEPPAPAPGLRIILIASDLLWLDGTDLRPQPLETRRERLQQVIQGRAILPPLGPAVAVPAMVDEARQLGAEAVLAKRRDSKYRPFGRNGDWVRVGVEPQVTSRAERRPGTARSDLGVRTSGVFGLGQMA